MTCKPDDPVTTEEIRARIARRQWSWVGPIAAIGLAIAALLIFQQEAAAEGSGTVFEEYDVSVPLTAISNAHVQIGSLPQFDPAHGTLVGVQVCQRVFGQHELMIMAMDPLPRIYEGLVHSRIELFGPPVSMSAPPLLSVIEQQTEIPPTRLAFGETAVASSPMLEDVAETAIDPSAWPRYVGGGTVPFTLEVRAFGQVAGSANVAYSLAAYTGLRISVRYELVPASALAWRNDDPSHSRIPAVLFDRERPAVLVRSADQCGWSLRRRARLHWPVRRYVA